MTTQGEEMNKTLLLKTLSQIMSNKYGCDITIEEV